MKHNYFHFRLLFPILLAFHLNAGDIKSQTFTSDPIPNTTIPDDGCYNDGVIEDTIFLSGLVGTLGVDIFISKVCINISHTYTDDIEVSLIGPDGTEVDLVYDKGDDGDNFINTCFSDEAYKLISNYDPPFTGLFRPSDDLYDFDGQSPNGNWRLVVCDDDDGDDTPGTLNDWQITFVDELCQGPDPVYIAPTLGGVNVYWGSLSNASSYLVEYGLSGFNRGTGIYVSTTDTTLTLTGLSPNESYKLYTYAICDGDTIYGTVKSFSSGCNALPGDYFESFEYDGVSEFAECWVDLQGGASIIEGPQNLGVTRWQKIRFAQLPGNTTGVGGRVFVEDEVDWLVSPYFDISDGDYELSFDIALNDMLCNWCEIQGGTNAVFFADDSIGVAITSDTGKTWQLIMVWDSSDMISPIMQHESFDLSMYGGTVHFGFFFSDGAIYDSDYRTWFIDNFRLSKYPDCTFPYDLASVDHSLDGATLQWMDSSDATEWEVEIIEPGVPRTGIATQTTSQTSLEWHGGESQKEYDYYVRGKCGGDSISSWSGPHTFCTLVDTFYHNFDDVYPDRYECYSTLAYTLYYFANIYFEYYDYYSEIGMEFYNDEDLDAYLLSILPEFYYHPGSDYTLKFRVKGDFDLIMGYITNPFDTSTFVQVETIQVNSTFDTISIVDTFSMGRIAFKAIMTGSQYKSTYIDDVRRTRTGGSPCAYNLTVGGTPLTDIYKAQSTITSDALILDGRSIIFEAGGNVLLEENFEVQHGASFEASGGVPCPD